jgi:predicted nucleic-acid-binding protein
LLYFEHPIALLIIIILTKGSSSRKEIVLIVIQIIIIQERNTIVKALDLYYRNRNKLDSFLILIDIYILFN